MKLGQSEFTIAEINEIAKFIKLDKDGLSYVLDISDLKAVRASTALQKAFQNNLFIKRPIKKFAMKSELLNAFLLTRSS